MRIYLAIPVICTFLVSCVAPTTADPIVVDQAVQATLTVLSTPSPSMSLTGDASTPSPELPNEAINAAHLLETKEICGFAWECKDYSIICAQQIELSAADQASGIEEQWCVESLYIRRPTNPAARTKSNPEGWSDQKSVYPFIVQRVGNTWEGKSKQCSCVQ